MLSPQKIDPDLPSPPPPASAPRVVIDVTWTDDARAALLNSPPQTVRAWNRALRHAIAQTCQEAAPIAHAARYLARQSEAQTWKIDASFVSDGEMTELNARYRGKNRPTDVLSFAQSEEIADEEIADEIKEDAFAAFAFGTPDELMWGDLVIAVETAQRQAQERAHDAATEVRFLAIHGTLHLLGYDHQNSTQRRIMWRAQETIFEPGNAQK